MHPELQTRLLSQGSVFSTYAEFLAVNLIMFDIRRRQEE